jgi:ubiquitin C-terminal hydrolase
MVNCLVLEVVITPRVYLELDHIDSRFATKKEGGLINRRHFTELLMDEGDETTQYRGLVNEGTTCYMNSLL